MGVRPNNIKIRVRFAILISLVVFPLLISACLILALGIRDQQISVRDVIITNITDSAFTVTWTSDTPYVGEIIYTEQKVGWPVLFAMIGSQKYTDDRQDDRARYTHHVTIRDLLPETTYSIRVGGEINGKEVPQSVTTAKLQESIETPNIAYGKVSGINSDETGDALILLGLNADDGPIISTHLSTSNTYAVDLSYFRMPQINAKNFYVVTKYAESSTSPHYFLNETFKPLETIEIITQRSGRINQSLISQVIAQTSCIVSALDSRGAYIRNGLGATDPIVGVVPYGTASQISVEDCSKVGLSNQRCKITGTADNYVACWVIQSSGSNAGNGNQTTTEQPTTQESNPEPLATTSTGLTCTDRINVEATNNGVNKNIRSLPNSDPATRIVAILAPTQTAEACRDLVNGWYNVAIGSVIGYVRADLVVVSPANSSSAAGVGSTNATVNSSSPVPQESTSGVGALGITTQCVDPATSDTIEVNSSSCPSGTIPAGSTVTTSLGGVTTIEVAAAPADNTGDSNYVHTCPDGGIVAGKGLTNDVKCRRREGRPTDKAIYFSPACNTPDGQDETMITQLGFSPKEACDYLGIERRDGNCTTGGWGTQSRNPCYKIVASNSHNDVLIIYSPGYQTASSFSHIFPEEYQENRYINMLSNAGFIVSIISDDKVKSPVIGRVVYELLTAKYRCITDGSRVSYNFDMGEDGIISRSQICTYLTNIVANSTNGCTEESMRNLANAAGVDQSGRACIELLKSKAVSYSNSGGTSLEDFNPFKSRIFAQGNQSIDPSIPITQPGIYNVTDGNFSKNVIVDYPENGRALIKLYIDANGNGKRDVDESYISDVGQFTISKTSDIVSYNFNAGWNLINIPLAMSTMSAANLIDKFSQSGVEVTHVTKYEAGQFISYVLRKGEPAFSNNFDIVPGEGYFVFAQSPGKVQLEGSRIESSVPLAKLTNGWNLVGIVSDTSYSSSSLIEKFGSSQIEVDTVSAFENGTYSSVVVDQGTKYGNDFNVDRKRGYFVKIVSGGGQTFSP